MARKTSGKSDTVIAFPGASRCPENGVAAEIVALLETYLTAPVAESLTGLRSNELAHLPRELAMKIGNADPLVLLATVTVAQRRLAKSGRPANLKHELKPLRPGFKNGLTWRQRQASQRCAEERYRCEDLTPRGYQGR